MDNGSPTRAPATDAGYRRILLVGFMGSGKSTVGPILASRLGWSFLDFDQEIERRAGLPVPEIFRRKGEGVFRELEAGVGKDALGADRAVLAPGGGWPAHPGRMEDAGADTLSVWLQVGPETSVARSRAGGARRPLLEVPDALGMARRLLDEREPYYALARLHLDSEAASPQALAEAILKHLEEAAGAEPAR